MIAASNHLMDSLVKLKKEERNIPYKSDADIESECMSCARNYSIMFFTSASGSGET